MTRPLKQREARCRMRVTTAAGSFPCQNAADVTVGGVGACYECARRVTGTPLADALERLLAKALPTTRYPHMLSEGTRIVRQIRRLEARHEALS